MAKFIVIYDEPKDKEGFEKYYKEVHIPLVNQMPKIKSVSLNHVIKAENTNGNTYLHVEIEYENLEALNESLSSEEGRKVAQDGGNLAPFLNSPPQILIAD